MATKHELAQTILALRQPNGAKPKMTWQAIADNYGPPVTKPIVWRIVNDPDYEPKDQRIRFALGLSITALVVPISGAIPEGTLCLAALQCVCAQWFIPNHPLREKCFVCSPVRKRKKSQGQTA